MDFSRACAAIAISLVSACGATPPPDPGEMVIAEARGTVLMQLSDPRAAEFGRVWTNERGIVCGFVDRRGFWYDPGTQEAYIARSGDWGVKASDAAVFEEQGCTIGPEHAKALEVGQKLGESDRRMAEIAADR